MRTVFSQEVISLHLVSGPLEVLRTELTLNGPITRAS